VGPKRASIGKIITFYDKDWLGKEKSVNVLILDRTVYRLFDEKRLNP
jgi:hypothetical protein